ncbi:MAG: MFS transporter [Actinomycetota bacterium]|nr:MFS transporter [Actinomycetota bacterium]
MTNHATGPASTLAPLRVVDYRRLLGGTFISALGLFLHAVAASWVMLELTGSPFMVGVVTASTFIPRLFAGIPAGALADIIDRRGILIWANVASAALALVLAWWEYSGKLTPALLVVFSLALGLAGAINLPAFQATLPDLVPRALVANAVSIQSGTFNVARVAGPAVGGILVGAGRSDLAFALNGVSYLFVSAAALTLKGAFRAEDLVPVRQAMLTGLRFVRHTGLILRVVVITCLFALTSASVQTLLPSFAQDTLGLGARGYGALYACFGGGALLGALLLERARQLIPGRWVIPLAISGFGATGVAFGFVRFPPVNGALLALLGLFWVWTLATLNATVQLSTPRWVRGRAMGIYLLAFTGFYPLGSLSAGAVAEIMGTAPSVALFCAPAVFVGLAARRIRLPALSDIVEPSLAEDWARRPHGDVQVAGGPVVVLTEWEIDPADASEFFVVMDQLRTHRYQTGAFRWSLFRNVEHPNRMTEVFEVVDWEEHLRQHGRVSSELVAVLERAHSFDRAGGPHTRHLVGITLGHPARHPRWEELLAVHADFHESS